MFCSFSAAFFFKCSKFEGTKLRGKEWNGRIMHLTISAFEYLMTSAVLRNEKWKKKKEIFIFFSLHNF